MEDKGQQSHLEKQQTKISKVENSSIIEKEELKPPSKSALGMLPQDEIASNQQQAMSYKYFREKLSKLNKSVYANKRSQENSPLNGKIQLITSQIFLETLGSRSQNDISSTSMNYNSSVFQLKQQKNLVVRDEQLLANRIQLLHLEEKKVMKKIQKTRERAQQILEIKKNNDHRHKSLMQAEIEREESIKAQQIKVFQQRMLKKQLNEQKLKLRQEYLKQNADEVKNERTQNNMFKSQIKLELQQINQKKKQDVKNQEIEALDKLQLRRNNIMKSIEQSYKHKQDREFNDIQKHESQINKMENVESQLLQRLQQTQKRESEIFKTLETAIKDSLLSHKDRLEFKQKKNIDIRKNYKLPPTLQHLQKYIDKNDQLNLTNMNSEFKGSQKPIPENKTNADDEQKSNPNEGKLDSIEVNLKNEAVTPKLTQNQLKRQGYQTNSKKNNL